MSVRLRAEPKKPATCPCTIPTMATRRGLAADCAEDSAIVATGSPPATITSAMKPRLRTRVNGIGLIILNISTSGTSQPASERERKQWTSKAHLRTTLGIRQNELHRHSNL